MMRFGMPPVMHFAIILMKKTNGLVIGNNKINFHAIGWLLNKIIGNFGRDQEVLGMFKR
jgi:hypothetical protein